MDTDGIIGEYVYGEDLYFGDEYNDERWKPIVGFPGYWVSNFGRIHGHQNKILNQILNKDGYYKVTLCVNGIHVDKRVNRLVAEAFLPNPNNLPIVMHLDNDRTNNYVDNLSWGTYSENNKYMYTCDRHPGSLTEEIREKALEKTRKPVLSINVKNGERKYFISQHDAARSLNVSQQHIWGVLNGYRKTTGGYKFEYATEVKQYD